MFDSTIISGVEKRSGPPVSLVEDSTRFIDVHRGSVSTVSGPWVEDGRWVVLKMRKFNDARALLESVLIDGRGVGISKKLGARVGDSYRVLSGEDVGKIYSPDFARFLADFVLSRPVWLV